MKIKQWLANIHDPNHHDAKILLLRRSGETPEQAWQHHLEYLKDKVIGAPKGKTYENLVGVYKMMTLREWIAHRWLLIKLAPGMWYRRKFVLKY